MGRAKRLVKELGIASPEQAEEKMRALQTELDEYKRRYEAARNEYERAEKEAKRAEYAFNRIRNDGKIGARELNLYYLNKWVTKRKLESDAVAALQMAFEHGCPHVRRCLRLANITVKFSAVAGKKWKITRHNNERQYPVIGGFYVYFERARMTYTVLYDVTEDSPTDFRTHCDLWCALIEGNDETFENGCSYSQRHEDNLLRAMFPRAFRSLNNIHAWLDELVAMTCQPALREHLRRQSGRRRYFATHSVAQIEYGQYRYL